MCSERSRWCWCQHQSLVLAPAGRPRVELRCIALDATVSYISSIDLPLRAVAGNSLADSPATFVHKARNIAPPCLPTFARWLHLSRASARGTSRRKHWGSPGTREFAFHKRTVSSRSHTFSGTGKLVIWRKQNIQAKIKPFRKSKRTSDFWAQLCLDPIVVGKRVVFSSAAAPIRSLYFKMLKKHPHLLRSKVQLKGTVDTPRVALQKTVHGQLSCQKSVTRTAAL